MLRGIARRLLDRAPLVGNATRPLQGVERRGRELDLVARVELMRATMDHGVNRLDVLAELAQQAAPFTASTGAPLWRAGDAAHRFLVVSSGSLRCTGQGRTSVLPAPFALGVLEAVAGLPRWCDSICCARWRAS